jgi:hypothetical protein
MSKKEIIVLLVLALAIILYNYLVARNNSQNIHETENTVAITTETNGPSTTSAVLSATTGEEPEGWAKYSDLKLKFTLEYPVGFDLKKGTGTVSFFKKDSIGKNTEIIHITERDLAGIETVSTISEKDINEKATKNPDRVSILDTIAPISIGSITAVTFKLNENSSENTYFYIPQNDNRFLEVSILGENNLSPEEISQVDRTVFSLETK